MTFNVQDMSKEEVQFIKLYCALIHRDYYSLIAVMAMMQSNRLGVQNTLTASAIAHDLAIAGNDFDKQILAIAEKHAIKEKTCRNSDSSFWRELADIFALSFFRVLAVQDGKATTPITLVKEGWCSGDPENLGAQIDLASAAHEDWQQHIISKIGHFFGQVFFSLPKTPKMKYPEPEHNDDDADYESDSEYEDDWYND